MSKPQLLLKWVKKHLAGYEGVEVTNWNTSWKSGLAWCALVHHFSPESIDFAGVVAGSGDDPRAALRAAFSAAERLGIEPLLDVEDIVSMPVPDQLSVSFLLLLFLTSEEKRKTNTHQKNTR